MNIDAAQGWCLIITSATGAFGTLYSLVKIKHNTKEVVKATEAAQEVKAAVVETEKAVKVAAQEVIEVKETTKHIQDLTNSNYTLQKAEIAELKSLLTTATAVGKAAEVARVTLATETAANLSATQVTPVVAEKAASVIIKP